MTVHLVLLFTPTELDENGERWVCFSVVVRHGDFSNSKENHVGWDKCPWETIGNVEQCLGDGFYGGSLEVFAATEAVINAQHPPVVNGAGLGDGAGVVQATEKMIDHIDRKGILLADERLPTFEFVDNGFVVGIDLDLAGERDSEVVTRVKEEGGCVTWVELEALLLDIRASGVEVEVDGVGGDSGVADGVTKGKGSSVRKHDRVAGCLCPTRANHADIADIGDAAARHELDVKVHLGASCPSSSGIFGCRSEEPDSAE